MVSNRNFKKNDKQKIQKKKIAEKSPNREAVTLQHKRQNP